MSSTTSQMDASLLELRRFVQQYDPCDAMRVVANAPATEQVRHRPRVSEDVIELERAIESHWPQGRVALVPTPQPLGLPRTCFSDAGSIRSVRRSGPFPARAAQLMKGKLLNSLVRPRRTSSPALGNAAASQQSPAALGTDNTSIVPDEENNSNNNDSDNSNSNNVDNDDNEDNKKGRLSRRLRCIALFFLCKKKRDDQAAAQGPPVLAPFELSDESLVDAFEANVPQELEQDYLMPAVPPSPGSSTTYFNRGSYYDPNKLPTNLSVIFRDPERPRPFDNQDGLPEDSPLGLLSRSLSAEQAAAALNQPHLEPSHGNGTTEDDDIERLNRHAVDALLPWSYGFSSEGALVRRPAIRRQGRARPAQTQVQTQPAARRQLPQTQHTDSIPIPTLAEVVQEEIDVVERPLSELDLDLEEDLPSSSSPSSSPSSFSAGFSSSSTSSSSISVYSNDAEVGDNDADVEPFVIEDQQEHEHEAEHQEHEQPMEQAPRTEQHTGELPPPPEFLWDWRIESHSAFPSPYNFGSAADIDANANIGVDMGAGVDVDGNVDAGFDSGFEADADSSSDATVTPAALGRLAPERNFGSWFTEVFTRRFWP